MFVVAVVLMVATSSPPTVTADDPLFGAAATLRRQLDGYCRYGSPLPELAELTALAYKMAEPDWSGSVVRIEKSFAYILICTTLPTEKTKSLK